MEIVEGRGLRRRCLGVDDAVLGHQRKAGRHGSTSCRQDQQRSFNWAITLSIASLLSAET